MTHLPTRRTIFATALALPQADYGGDLLPAARAVEAMRGGGLNVYMRHAITDRSQADTGRLGYRSGQRNLDARGRVQAREFGRAMRALGVPVGRVFTSEVFRTRDTAEIPFGAATVLDELVADDDTASSPAVDAAATRARLVQRPPSGNDVFVGHIVPFGLILGRTLSHAAFLEESLGLLRPDGTRFEEIGIVSAEAIIEHALVP